MHKIHGNGPDRADIVIVNECPDISGGLFSKQAEVLLDKALREAGIRRDACYVTNVCKYVPPGGDIEKWLHTKKREGKKNDWPLLNGRYASPEVHDGLSELFDEVASRRPRIVIGLGNTALWAFTGEWSITDWRGSEIPLADQSHEAYRHATFVPTLHPAGVLRAWATRAQLVHDLKVRVARRVQQPAVEPQWDFNIAPTFAEVCDFLKWLPDEAAVDVETSRGQIVCVGIAVSDTKAMCIPFISEGYGAYWTAQEANAIKSALAAVLQRKRIIGQNFNYDASYFDDNFETLLRCTHDTKIAQNVLYPGTPANLGYLSSMNCDWHRYWKDDARDWQNLREFDRLFTYNCRDCCATFEIAQAQKRKLHAIGLTPQFEERMRYAASVFDMQQRGVIRDDTQTAQLEAEIEDDLLARSHTIETVAGGSINIASPAQVATLLYTNLGCRKPLRAAGGTGDEALKQVAKWHPEHAGLLTAILEWRALSSVRNNFLRAKLDADGLLRSSFLTTGTETFRLTSSKNNFGRGTNLLNISGNGFSHSGNKLPNLRRCIVPPHGHTIFDCDLERADLQVVVWEADDTDLKSKLRAGVDIHLENARDIFGVREPTKFQREMGKKFVHLTNYGGGARTCAIEVGMTVHEADMGQRRWFAVHPGIKRWHARTKEQLESTRTITNAFGYRIIFMDRIDDAMLRDALAWKPQSTIAIVASLVHMNIDTTCVALGTQMLLQMYDSVMGSYPTHKEALILPHLHAATRVVIPYDDPLIIPMGIKTSTVSWGDCKKRENGWDVDIDLEAA